MDKDKKAAYKREIDDLLLRITDSKRIFDYEAYFSEVFHSTGGFDVVIGNPPYLDSETMVRENPRGRQLIAGLYGTTRGNWDLYIPFWELSLKKVNRRGTVTLITPNKWLSIGYGRTLRNYSMPFVYKLVDYSKYRAFENTGVFPVVVLMAKTRSEQLSIRTYLEGQKLIFKQELPVDYLGRFENWGVFLSSHLPLILNLVKRGPNLSRVCNVEEAFTVSEAYELTKFIHEWKDGKRAVFKFVNTGTIDPYMSLWGIKQATYIKAKYLKPVIDREEFRRKFPRRYNQSMDSKIIISGIRHFECFSDEKGEYMAGKSTVILRQFDKCVTPEFLVGILNSLLVKFFLKECYGSLAMDGGINFSPANVSQIPVNHESKQYKKAIGELAERVLSAKKRDPKADTTALEREIDRLVYALYDLTQEEIAIVEGDASR